MASEPSPLLVVGDSGLYCPAGDFHVDPWRPVERALITHGHGDHLRSGNGRYWLAAPGLGIARARVGAEAAIEPVPYREPLRFGATTVSWHPAGHVLGSAQLRIEHEGRVWVVSGDYKRDPDPTCEPFEPQRCDVFISEATFALPIYRWPPAAQVVGEIHAWWQGNRERGLASLLFCYSLGKAQRVLAELLACTREPVYVHGAVDSLVRVYREAGIDMVPTLPATAEAKRDYRGALVVAPPSAAGSPWLRRFGEHASGFCSGWMRVRGNRRRRGYDRGFVLSDHADWPGLVRSCEESGAREILLTHGHTDALARYLTERGRRARALATAYGAEDLQ